jgi:UDP-glucose:glycoprotein glucosyltransferase
MMKLASVPFPWWLAQLVILILVLIPLYETHSPNTKAFSPSVRVRVKANWPHTPLLLEAGEYYAKRSSKLYWELIESMLDDSLYESLDTEEKAYLKIQWVLQKMIRNGNSKLANEDLEMHLLRLVLANRIMSPAVEFHRDIERQHKSTYCKEIQEIPWVLFLGECVTSPTQMQKLITQISPKTSNEIKLFPQDHIFRTKRTKIIEPPIAILYADLSSPRFAEWHELLKHFARDEFILYVQRHVTREENRSMYLQDYGVELFIKNMDYRSIDECKDCEGSRHTGWVFSFSAL